MISIALPPTAPIFTETRPTIEFLEKRNKNEDETILSGYDFNYRKNKEQSQTNFNFSNSKDEKKENSISKYTEVDDNLKFTSGFSENYIEYNSGKMVNEILTSLNYWLNNGTENSYHVIAQIKDSVSDYTKYLTQKKENRLFLNGIKLLIDNNNWEELDEKRLKNFIFEVKRFEDGDINWNRLELFSKQIKRMKLNILKEDGEEKK